MSHPINEPQYPQYPQNPQGHQPPQGYGQQPPPPGYGPPPQGYGPPPQPPKGPLWKKKRFLIPVGLIVLFSLIGIGSGGDDPQVAAPAASASATQAAPTDDPTTEAPAPEKITLVESCTVVPGHLTDLTDEYNKIDDASGGEADAAKFEPILATFQTDKIQAVPELAKLLEGPITFTENVMSTLKNGGDIDVTEFKKDGTKIVDLCTTAIGDEPTAEATEEPTEEPAPEPTKKAAPKPKKNPLSDEQQDAVGAAQDYLDFKAFSKKGLIDQLSSKYGSGFSKKDATKAVESMDIDYKDQAVKAAKEYRDFQHFSRSGLIQQLESSYGSGFTHKQAVYGADHSR